MINQNIVYFSLIEIKYRFKCSFLLWMYYIGISLVFMTSISAIFFLNIIISINSNLGLSILLTIIFLPFNLAIFSRETDLDMNDFFIMRIKGFKTVLLTRFFTNIVLMVFPVVLFSTLIMINNLLNGENSIIIGYWFFFMNITSVLLFWILLGEILLLIVELKIKNSSFRYLLYYIAMIILILPTLFIDQSFVFLYNIKEIFIPLKAFNNVPLAFIILITLDIVLFWILAKIVKKRTSTVIERTKTRGLELNVVASNNHSYYSLLESLKLKWKKKYRLILYFSIPLICVITNPFYVLGLIVSIGSFYMAFVNFPRITIEKEFKMEEMILSRISASKYFLLKVKSLYEGILIPLSTITVLILISQAFHLLQKILSLTISIEDTVSLFGMFSLLFYFYFKLGYVASLLTFMWRMLPSKDLLNTAVIIILMIDIIGAIFYVVISFSLLNNLSLLFFTSPILSNILLILPTAELSSLVSFSADTFFLYAVVSIVFMLASLAMIKTSVQYE